MARVFLHGALSRHRRGRVLAEVLSATPADTLPADGGVVILFGDDFQGADLDEQSRLVEWTRAPGRLVLLLPPFAQTHCQRPVSWRTERVALAPRSDEALANALASEVGCRLLGTLQPLAVPGAVWKDLSVCVGGYRLHPAAGLFAVTCLPLWSLSVLDIPQVVEAWLDRLITLAGAPQAPAVLEPAPLQPDHFGFLVFLHSQNFASADQALDALRSSPIFRYSEGRARTLLSELVQRGLVVDAAPTQEATDLVLQSPYAPYLSAIREVLP
jgi:hypothetical protein